MHFTSEQPLDHLNGTKRFRGGQSALLWKKVILTRILSIHSQLRPIILSLILVKGWSTWLRFDGVLFGEVLTMA